MHTIDTASSPSPATAALPATRPARTGAWLLTLSPLYFVVVVAAGIPFFAVLSQEQTFYDITRAQMDQIQGAWAVQNTVFPLAHILGLIGTVLLAATLRGAGGTVRTWATVTIAVAAASILLFLPYAPLRIAAAGFTEPTLGENPFYLVWDVPKIIAFVLAPVAVATLCAALLAAGRHRIAAIVIGGLSIVVAIAFALQLPLPPFAVALLCWLPLGIVWLRALRRQRRRS